jgi:hypothetical protein
MHGPFIVLYTLTFKHWGGCEGVKKSIYSLSHNLAHNLRTDIFSAQLSSALVSLMSPHACEMHRWKWPVRGSGLTLDLWYVTKVYAES